MSWVAESIAAKLGLPSPSTRRGTTTTTASASGIASECIRVSISPGSTAMMTTPPAVAKKSR